MDYRDCPCLLVAAFRFPRSLLHANKPKDYDVLLEVPDAPDEEEDNFNMAGLFEFEEEQGEPARMVQEEAADLEEEPNPHLMNGQKIKYLRARKLCMGQRPWMRPSGIS